MMEKVLSNENCWKEVIEKISSPITTVLRDSHDIPGLTESNLIKT
jgi:hypothetical protein